MAGLFWQQIAKLYDNDLKAIYQPNTDKEDQLIEQSKEKQQKKLMVKLTCKLSGNRLFLAPAW